MGFRSTLTTQDYDITWPDWFVAKYHHTIDFKRGNYGVLQAGEQKVASEWPELAEDIQLAIDWGRRHTPKEFVLVYLHECGGITRCKITKDAIQWSEPSAWNKTNGITHHESDDCYYEGSGHDDS